MSSDPPKDPTPIPATPVLEYRSAGPAESQVNITARTQELMGQGGTTALVIGGILLSLGPLLVIVGLGMAIARFSPGVVAVVVGVAITGPSVFLRRSGIHTREFLRTMDGNLLEKAFEATLMFWKTLGVAMLVATAIIWMLAGMRVI